MSDIECEVINSKAFTRHEIYDFVRPTILKDN